MWRFSPERQLPLPSSRANAVSGVGGRRNAPAGTMRLHAPAPSVPKTNGPTSAIGRPRRHQHGGGAVAENRARAAIPRVHEPAAGFGRSSSTRPAAPDR
jgi:hypothetical protein